MHRYRVIAKTTCTVCQPNRERIMNYVSTRIARQRIGHREMAFATGY